MRICARAVVENRGLTLWEEEQVRTSERAYIRSRIGACLINILEKIKQEAKRGPLDRCQQRKRFEDVVRETPRREGETFVSWIRRIWDECEKYDTTHRPTVITEELLERYSRGARQKRTNNLPLMRNGFAKSFRSQ